MRYSLYLLYWHKSTNTDAKDAAARARWRRGERLQVLSWHPQGILRRLLNVGIYACSQGVRVCMGERAWLRSGLPRLHSWLAKLDLWLGKLDLVRALALFLWPARLVLSGRVGVCCWSSGFHSSLPRLVRHILRIEKSPCDSALSRLSSFALAVCWPVTHLSSLLHATTHATRPLHATAHATTQSACTQTRDDARHDSDRLEADPHYQALHPHHQAQEHAAENGDAWRQRGGELQQLQQAATSACNKPQPYAPEGQGERGLVAAVAAVRVEGDAHADAAVVHQLQQLQQAATPATHAVRVEGDTHATDAAVVHKALRILQKQARHLASQPLRPLRSNSPADSSSKAADSSSKAAEITFRVQQCSTDEQT